MERVRFWEGLGTVVLPLEIEVVAVMVVVDDGLGLLRTVESFDGDLEAVQASLLVAFVLGTTATAVVVAVAVSAEDGGTVSLDFFGLAAGAVMDLEAGGRWVFVILTAVAVVVFFEGQRTLVGLDTVLSEVISDVAIAFRAGVVVLAGVAVESLHLVSGVEHLILITRLEFSTGTLFVFVTKDGEVVLFDTAGTTRLSVCVLTAGTMIDLSSGKENFDLTTRCLTSVEGTTLPGEVAEPVEAALLVSGSRSLIFFNLAVTTFMLDGGVVVEASGPVLGAFLMFGSPSRLRDSSASRLAVVTVGGGRRPKKKFALSLGFGGEDGVLLVLFRVIVRFSTVAGLVLTLTLDLGLGVVDEKVAEVYLTAVGIVESGGWLPVFLLAVVCLKLDFSGVLVSESTASLVVEARDGFLLTKNLSKRI